MDKIKAIKRLEQLKMKCFGYMGASLEETLGWLVTEDHEVVGYLYRDGQITNYSADLLDTFIEEVKAWLFTPNAPLPEIPNIRGVECLDTAALVY